MRFHYVDRITDMIPGSRITGIKNVSAAEDLVGPDATGRLALPEPLLLECLAQLGVWFLMGTSDGTERAVLLSVESARFRGAARPGDQLILNLWVESRSPEAAMVSGRIDVDGSTILQMTNCLCAIVPAGDLEDPTQAMARYRLLSGHAPGASGHGAGHAGVEPASAAPALAGSGAAR